MLRGCYVMCCASGLVCRFLNAVHRQTYGSIDYWESRCRWRVGRLDRQLGWQSGKQVDRLTESGRQLSRQVDRDRQTVGQAGWTDRQTYRQTDNQQTIVALSLLNPHIPRVNHHLKIHPFLLVHGLHLCQELLSYCEKCS